MTVQSPSTPPCAPGKRTRRSRSTPESERTEVRRAPPGEAAVAVAVDTFERMATRHMLSIHDVSEAKNGLDAAAQEERDASSEFASAFFRASDATAAADAVSRAPVTRRIASVFRDAEVCTQKQKTAAKRVADAAKKREAAERTLRLAEAAARLADDAFDPVAAARDAAATVSGRLSPFQAVVEARREDDVTKSEGRLPTLLERRSVEESSPQSDASECDAPPKKKPAAIPLSPVAPAAGAKHRSWTPERKAEEARAEANALADMLRAAVIK